MLAKIWGMHLKKKGHKGVKKDTSHLPKAGQDATSFDSSVSIIIACTKESTCAI